MSRTHYRTSLPHLDGPIHQMITYRLADSLPLKTLNLAPKNTPAYRQYIERQLDAGYGSCLLKIPSIATAILNNWQYFHGQRYRLLGGVIMPNHVHVLIEVIDDVSLTTIVHSWKTWSGKHIREYLTANGIQYPPGIWQRDYWDRYIRSQQHLDAAMRYIQENPLKAGLVDHAEDWPWKVNSPLE